VAAVLSDRLVVVAVLAYLVAMVLHALEFALADHTRLDQPNDATAKELLGAAVVVAASRRGAASSRSGNLVTALPRRPHDGPQRAFSSLTIAITSVGALAHFGALLCRGWAANRLPWGNMYEFMLSSAFVGAVVWLVILVRRPGLFRLGLFASLGLVFLLGLAGLVAYVPVGPVMPALHSYWFAVHVLAAVVSSGIFFLGVVPASMFLIRDSYEHGRRTFPFSMGRWMPTAGSLERTTYMLHAFAFPIWTFAVLIAGPIWAEASWGRYWGWDPKEVWAFVSWVVYAAYLHARATGGFKRRVTIYFVFAGWLTILMNLFGVNLYFHSFHSYSGI
jgi:cytochrome c-type biogenesis protein CcsB